MDEVRRGFNAGGARPRMLRQGDVLLVEDSDRRSAASGQPVERDGEGRLVLAEGEATGHLHAVSDASARLVTHNGTIWLLAPGGGATLTHDEHAPVKVPEGRWRVVRQREWSDGSSVQVAD